MNAIIKRTLMVAGLCLTLAANAPAAQTEAGMIDFGSFTPAAGAEFVEVNVNSNLITMVLDLAKKSEPDIVNVLKGLKAVRVNAIGLTDENREEVQKRVHDIRQELDSKGWERVVTAIQEHKDVGVFVRTRGSEAVEGVVVTAIENNKQAVLVNVIGDIRPEKLVALGERFNIEPLKHLGIPGEKH